MWRSAFLGSGKLVVTLVYHPSVFIIAVPNLGTEPMTARPTLDAIGEYGGPAVPASPPVTAATFNLGLHQIECGWRYNCFVVSRYIVLRNLPFILFYFLGQEINGEPCAAGYKTPFEARTGISNY